MEKNIFLFLLLLITIDQIYNYNIVKIPFKYYPTYVFFENQSHPLTKIHMSQIAIELSIGTPPQTFNLSLNLNFFYSLFLSHQIPGIDLHYFYNKTLSSTYNCTSSKKYYYKEDFDYAEIFNDKIYLKENEYNFNFLLIDGLGYDVPNEFYASGLIGLRLINENNYLLKDENRFLYQIKKYNLSKTEVFYFDFNNDNNTDNGDFVIGEDLFDDTDNFLQIKVGYLKMPTLSTEWSFNFDAIYYGEREIKLSLDALIKTENGLILGPTEYEEIIKEFFENSTKCYSNRTKMGYATYRYYYCDEDFEENTMEDLIFELQSINFSFVFHGKDLFLEENGVKYFKIIFLYYSINDYWYLGRDFLKKYKIRFDSDRKLIYIPLNKNNNNNETNDSDSNNDNKNNNDNSETHDSDSNKDNKKNNELSIINNNIFWIIIGLSCFIVGLIIFIVICLKKYPRNKRINEIEDDEDYDYKNSEEKEGIN